MDYNYIIKFLEANYNETNRQGMARFGINVSRAVGVSISQLRPLAKEIKKNHPLALLLWKSGIHEARLLAALIADSGMLTEETMEEWVKDFNSWDIVDITCMHLFDRSPLGIKKALEWVEREEEFVKRAGFTILAATAVHDKKRDDQDFVPFLNIIEMKADDSRNFVKKAMNWALRQIGKRSHFLRDEAIKTAARIVTHDSKAAQWIARDALRELNDPNIIERIKR